MLSLVSIARGVFFFLWEGAFPCSVYCERPDIVNAGSGETRYSECRVRGDQI
ncbi:unnamed protein product [Staurois parvus]|uniref:Uncharacterized protein n=1 Tax=Staurois parvus TaxID=386267 RepID=A0ABN9BWU8_9NEOB|nr:unnamed protein product [Staurois parvus]